MTLNLPLVGETGWGVKINNALTDLDTRATTQDTTLTSLDGRLDVVEPAVTSLDGRVGVVEASLTAQPVYVPRDSLAGPATTDITSVTPGAAADGTQNEQYVISGNALPAIWPVDLWGGGVSVASNVWAARTSNPAVSSSGWYRFMCDGTKFSVLTGAVGFVADVYVDGLPYANNPVTLAATAGYSPYGFLTLVFPTAKPRLIEIRTAGGLSACYTVKPYRIWKPPPDPNPKIAVLGDSYVAPTVMNDAASGSVTSGAYDLGIYQRMGHLLGSSAIAMDGIGGTGYIAGGGSGMPYGHANRLAWLQSANPDVIVVHGGGANDLNAGNSVSAVVAAVTGYFQTLRAQFPTAKLVFMEGFAPPSFTPGTYNPNYIAVRQGVQAALSTMRRVYYLDVATTRPPLNGTGYVTATNSSGNSDIYVGSDATHLTIRGNLFVRHVLAPKLRRVLADNGRLSGALIL